MSNTPKAANQTFDKELKLALKHFHEPDWLDEQSPLASHYMLADYATQNAPRPETAVWHMGRILQRAVLDTADILWGDRPPRYRHELETAVADILQTPGSDRYAYLILELRYLHRFFKPRRLQEIWEAYLGQSRAEFYRDLDHATGRLGELLLRRLQPTFRLEQAAPVDILYGRDDLIRRAQTAVRSGQSVTISGAGGIGKTSLATAVVAGWQSADVFWYTIRPTLNDSLPSLLFALAHFLQQHDQPLLWQKLLANGATPDDLHLLTRLAHADLAAAPRPLLLCFDETDRLLPGNPDEMLPRHRQLLEFLDGLRESAPLLLVGQRAVIDSDLLLTLDGLTDGELARWLEAEDVPQRPRDVARLLAYSGGNPRMIQLCLALRDPDEALRDLLQRLPASPALQPLFARLWARLTAVERSWLQAVAIFRSAMPADAVELERSARVGLVERRLLQADGQGGLLMWPALSDIINRELTAERREQLHLQAAAIRAQRGEFTAAAHHYHQAGWARQAVQIWFPQRQLEISRGQGAAALAIFEQISTNQLPRKEREALAVLRAELRQLAGDLRGGRDELTAVDWPDMREITAEAHRLRGTFELSLGYPDAALKSYDDGIATVARLLSRLVVLRNKRGRVLVRQRALEPAWQEARQAQLETENLHGVILAEQGDYAGADAAHRRALSIAEDIADERGIAQAHYELAILMGYQGRLDEMIAHTQVATDYYERIGDLYFANMARINLAAAYIQTKRFEDAVATAVVALPFFEKIQDPYGMAASASNLAEAHFELGDLPTAERYAYDALQREEPHIMPYAMFTLGLIRRAQQRLRESADALQMAANLAQQNEDLYLLAYTQRALGEVHSTQQQLAEALELLQSAQAIFEQLGLAHEVETTATVRTSVAAASNQA